ncbi:hypothetical protein CCUS01_06171 [Colletotrichum cuscutae]|uniref:Zn(2)-C6 fungal-type domain-containing protein n=1 Tax=Colletotrichum cuscutae TaxID=1209917 RepID=A0AAI9V8P1_9PEZI|nr:hypothetical protein CCUS01_06171 [Colletotrichum cuscutae]
MEKTMVSPPAASPSTISPASSSHLGKRHDHSEDAQESSSGGGYNGGPSSTTGRKSSSSGGSRPKRAQVSRACARCKNLRRACNEYRPCKRCVDAGLGDQCLGLPGPVSLAWVSDGSQAFGHIPREAVQRMADLLPARVMDYCVDRFFARLHPTIPILTPEYVAQMKVVAGPSEVGMEAHCLLTAVCALVLLQVEEPESLWIQGLIPEKNALHGRMLFEEALAAHRNFARRSNPTFEQCLLTFFLGDDAVLAAADAHTRGVGESGGGGAGGPLVLGSVGVGAVARDPVPAARDASDHGRIAYPWRRRPEPFGVLEFGGAVQSAGHVVHRAVEYGKGGDAAVERGVDVYRDGGECGAAVDFGPQGHAKGEFEGDAAVVADHSLAAASAVRVPC